MSDQDSYAKMKTLDKIEKQINEKLDEIELSVEQTRSLVKILRRTKQLKVQ